MTNITTTTDAFAGVVAAWDESLVCETIYDCPNTAPWLAVPTATPGPRASWSALGT